MPDHTDDHLAAAGQTESQVELKGLIFRRGQLKGQITRFSNFLANINEFTLVSEIKFRLTKAHGIFSEYDDVQSQIECFDMTQYDDRENFENNYFHCIAKAQDFIDIHERTNAQTSNSENNTQQILEQISKAISIPSSTTSTSIQPLSVPQFSGSYESWLTFYQIFKSLIHDNSNLSKIQKFFHLQSCLRGEALQVLQSLEITEANYDTAIDLLRERYENTKVLIHNHVRNIFELPSVQKESHLSLRKLIDKVTQNIRALQNLKEPTEYWDTLLIHLISNKLDSQTRREWEIFNKKDRPKYQDFLTFLKNKCQILETLDCKTQSERTIQKTDSKINTNKYHSNNNKNYPQKSSFVHVSTENSDTRNLSCNYCKTNTHYIYKCHKLLSFSPKERYSELNKLGICTNCLKIGHNIDDCLGKNCRVCNKRHNSILHDYSLTQKSFQSKSNTGQHPSNNRQQNSCNVSLGQGCELSESTENSVAAQDQQIETIVNCVPNTSHIFCSSESSKSSQILLATATVYILDREKKPIKCRALLDSASQSNFCTAELFSRLNINSVPINMPISGINQTSCNISEKFNSKIQSLDKSFTTNISCLVIDRITSDLPQISFDSRYLNIPSNIKLADPQFDTCQKIDLLLGTEIFFKILNNEQIKLGNNKPIIQNTKLGWILAGPLHQNISETPNKSNCFLSIQSLHEKVEKFWQIENIDISSNKLTSHELECEIHFRENTTQDETGRYIVKLPFKNNVEQLGESYSIAKKCLLSTEKRLQKDTNLRKYYNEFLEEYADMGHMTLINPEYDKPNQTYNYLPHHPVFKNSSSTSKVRIVFNASSKTSSGLSLNDVLKTGPKVQNDLFDIILRMRTYPIVLIADVEKMYRMVLIHESQRNYQRILWRTDPTQEISHYQLNTIVYGFSSSSFLATRVLNEIGQKCQTEYPQISEIIINDFYMDDLITGTSDIESAIQLKQRLSEILSKSGLNLRKWLSNKKSVLEHSPKNNEQFHIKSAQETKTLGIFWDHVSDTLSYTFQINFSQEKITKRCILSGVASLFDPLGLISPVIVNAKLILQEVWKNNYDWDENLPENITSEWLEFIENIKHLNSIKIPRCVISQNSEISVQLHGFCDSSQKAYGAAIYLIFQDSTDQIQSNLICSKSRLAPLKSPITIPKLELSSAYLLAQLMYKVSNALRLQISKITYWTDSTIVLAWLNAEPSKWKVFVCNRVAEIQRLTENHEWRHVDTNENPADILSRGCDPQTLQNAPLWWYGSSFLKQDIDNWPKSQVIDIASVPEARKEKITLTYSTTQNDQYIFNIFSSYTKLVRITAYLIRFKFNVKCKAQNLREQKRTDTLSFKELDDAVTRLCYLSQKEDFAREIKCLENNQPLPKNSKLKKLNPFIDSDGLIRVGGRLKNANIPFDQKYPIVLPNKHCFVKLIINHYHHKFLHGGPQLILSQIRNTFWPLNGRNEVRNVLRKCLTCFRIKPTDIQQLMGSLPESRVTPSRPFSFCGVDFAGPYLIKDGRTRSCSLIKAYISNFICFSTRAVHVELVTELTSEAFLNAFKRFVSRRGLCNHIYSDNATNFVGSNHELQRLCQVVKDSVNNKYQSYFTENRICWHFIPPRSPHCGGLWESAVKSFKYHLKRVIGETKLDFESFYTILTQVEAILNSRPILPLSDDPMDLQSLTPGHFLVGGTLVAVPQDDVTEINKNRLKYFKQLQQIVQSFWKVWSKTYLHTLQQRSKWLDKNTTIKVGTMCIVKEDNEPPMHWPLARVVAVHPGSDELVRVVSIQMKNGIFKRAITRLCPLPLDE